MTKPVLSFIVPHRNHGEHVGGCIQSCLSASRLPLEVICIDDDSDDGSAADALAWGTRDKRVRVFRNEKRLGVERTLNRGLSMARGEFVVFRAADDRSLPGFLDRAVALLEAVPRAAYCLGDIRFFVDNESRGRLEVSGTPGPERYVAPGRWNEDFGGEGLTVAAALARREAAVSIGGMAEELRWLSDWTFMVELGFRDGIVYLPQPSCAMKIHGASYNSVGSADVTANGGALRSMLGRLAGKGDAFVEVLANSRTLGFFRTGLTALDGAGSLWKLGERERRLWESAFAERPAVRADCGMPLALRSFLEESRAEICAARGVAILGAGGHTRLLLEQWRRFELPEPVAVLTGEVGRTGELCGVPLEFVGTASAGTFDTIVLSSKSYESELARLSEVAFPEARILKVWG